MGSMGELMHASHNINDWVFEMQPPPKGCAKTTVGRYFGKCKKTGIVRHWDIDEADLKIHGSLEEFKKHAISGFSKSLAMLALSIEAAKKANSPIILPQRIKNAAAEKLSAEVLLKGDHGH